VEAARGDVGTGAEAIEALFNGGDEDWPELSFAGAFLFAEFFALIRGLTKAR
jgi:hypothetical protein